MSINSRHAVNQAVTRKFGKFYGTIDFDVNHELTAKVFKQSPTKYPVGTFIIGNSAYDLTMDELELIERTAREARETILKRYQMGMMGTLA